MSALLQFSTDLLPKWIYSAATVETSAGHLAITGRTMTLDLELSATHCDGALKRNLNPRLTPYTQGSQTDLGIHIKLKCMHTHTHTGNADSVAPFQSVSMAQQRHAPLYSKERLQRKDKRKWWFDLQWTLTKITQKENCFYSRLSQRKKYKASTVIKTDEQRQKSFPVMCGNAKCKHKQHPL